jgi:hypothetical protein
MKRLAFFFFLAGIAILTAGNLVWAAGSADRLYGYALAGASPKAVFVVIDSNGNGVKGVPITVNCSTGTLDVVSGNTGADGTLTVQQSGAGLGSLITASVSVPHGSPFTITTANGADRVDLVDPTYFWFDESRRLVNMVSVTSGKNVLTLPAKSSFRFDPEDKTSNGRDITISQNWSVAVQQTTTGPIQFEVYQGTFQNGDDILLYDSVFGRWLNGNGNGFGEIVFSPNQPNHYLYAYAVDGASPTVCAVVTDANGVGVSGVTVSIAATAGTFPLTSDVTGDGGRVYFYQQGGTFGNTITVSCSALAETSPVQIITQSSQTMQTTDKLFSWFSRKSRRVYTAVVNRQTNVLVTSVLAPTWSANYFTNGADPNQRPAESTGVGVLVDQTSQQPAMAAVPHGSTVSGDIFYLWNLPTLYHCNNYQCAITLPANEPQYLLAFASGGPNPTIWAAVTDATGNAVKGVTVNFGLQGTGTLATASGSTSWNGMLTNLLAGAAAEGNTITVTATGLGTITIVTSDSQAVASSDRVYSWYDPATHKIFGAVVTMATNVMTVSGTSVGGSAVKRSAGNNTPTLGYSLAYEQTTAQSVTQPFIGHAGFGTISAGDFIRITQNVTSNQYDTHIIAAADPAKFLVAFAQGGANPNVWALVMDNKGNGLEGEPVTFSAGQGTMSLGSATTGYGGFVVSTQSGGSLGNAITVSAPGLPPVTVNTAAAPPANGHNDNGVAWYDASRMTIWGISFDEATHVIETSQSWYDWFSGGPVVTYTSGGLKVNKAQAFDFTRKINQLAQWTIAFGTANAGDECWADLALIRSYIHINTVKPSYLRACANPGANPSSVRAIVVDTHGVGLPSVPVNFAASAGSMSGGPFWTTGLDGTANSAQSGGSLVVGDVLTVSSAGYPDVQIQTNASGIVANNSPAVFWYDPNSRCLNSLMIQQPWHNVIVTSQANILFAPLDQTPNNKTLAITGPKEAFAQTPTYGYVAEGTSGAGDQIVIQNNTVWGTNAGLLTLPADLSKYLWAFAAGGANPKVWAAVTDANGNGISGAPVHIIYPGPVTVNLATDTTGVTTNARNGIALGNNISINADGVANTINVTVANAINVDSYARAMGWYDVINRTGYGAFVTVPNNVMASSTSAAFTPVDTTPNGLTFALGTSNQQTVAAPASVSVANGSQGQGDIVQFDESTTTAAPDMQLSINVPASGIASSIVTGPNPVVNGQYISVTMTVFNNGATTATSVSPTALSVAGGAGYFSGPMPLFVASIPGGGSQNFIWTYAATAPGGVTFTGQAFGVDSYTLNNLTSTATNSNPILVRNPNPPALIITSFSTTPTAISGDYFTVTMTVQNNSGVDVPGAIMLTPQTTLDKSLPPGSATQVIPSPVSVLVAPGSVTLTGQVYATDPFTSMNVTKTASTYLTIRNPNPPKLTIASLAVSPSAQWTGQFVYVTMTVRNDSDADVPGYINVTPSALTPSIAATLVSPPSPAYWALQPGQTAEFTWLYTASAAGNLTFTGQAYTTDPFTTQNVTATASTTNVVTVQDPHAPVLLSTLAVPGTPQLTNSYIYVTMTVTNNSTAEVASPLNVSPTALTLAGSALLISGPTPLNADISGQGGQHQFVWEYQVTAPTGVTFTGKAYTLNPFNDSGVTSTATNAFVAVRNPLAPALISTLAVPAAQQLTNSYIYVTMTVTNNSGNEVSSPLNVSPTALTLAGSAALVSGPTPPNWDISGQGGQHQFIWEYQVTAPAGVTFTGQAYTLNPFDYSGATSTASNAYVAVRNPHAPAIVLTTFNAGPVSPNLLVGQYIAVTMTVLNNSDSDVPNAITITPLALGITGGASLHSGPFPAQAYVAPGNTGVFWWDFTATSAGGVSFNGQASTVNPFNYQGVTATAAVTNLVTVRNPKAPTIAPVVSVFPLTAGQYVSTGQYMTVSMTVTNSSDPEVASPVLVTPLPFNGVSGMNLASGPTPGSQSIARNGTGSFSWTYLATNYGNTVFNGQAAALDPFDYHNVTTPATAPVYVTIQTPASLSAVLTSPLTAERLMDFTVTMTVTNNGQAAAMAVSPTALTLNGTNAVTLKSGPVPAGAIIPSGQHKDFVWTYTAAGNDGTIQLTGQANGWDANSNSPVATGQLQSGQTNVFQGALNLDQVNSTSIQVYRGQNSIPVTMQVRNTSLMPVTITATTLNFNGASSSEFTVISDPGNPQVVPGQASFSMQFAVNISKNAPLGSVVIDGRVVGTSGGREMSTTGASQTSTWEILEPVNQLRQNYPNPLRLSRKNFTTIEYTLQDDVASTLKVYNLAGELVAVLVDGSPGVGKHVVQWYGDNGNPGQRGKTVGSGVYLVVLQSGGYKEIKKVVVIR